MNTNNKYTTSHKKSIVIGNIELKNSSCFIDGKLIKDPVNIGNALLKYAQLINKPIDFSDRKSKLIEYLKLKRSKITEERLTILKTIHELDDPFNINDVYNTLQDKEISISRLTVYNALRLFQKANIVSHVIKDETHYGCKYFELAVF